MKAKLFIIKYIDWFILSLLAIGCLFVVYRTFFKTENEIAKIGEDIRRFESRIKQGMANTEKVVIPPRDLVQEMRERFDHLAVIPPFSRNPFITLEDITVPSPVVVAKDQSITRTFKSIRFLDLATSDPHVEVTYKYDRDADATDVMFKGLVPGNGEVRLTDEVERAWKFTVVVQEKTIALPPNPPTNVMVVARQPDPLHYTPAVLITFTPDQPAPNMARTIGYTSGAQIYRKPADATDAEYILITHTMITPLATVEDVQQLTSGFLVAPGPVGPAAPGNPENPEEAAPEGVPPPAPAAGLVLQPGSFGFKDETVEEGESYTYKIVTYSIITGSEPTPTATPYVIPEMITVPALVTMKLTNTFADGHASFALTRIDPTTGQPRTETVNVYPGMPISKTVNRRVAGVDARGRPEYKNIPVEYSTNCILVDTMHPYPEIRCGVNLRPGMPPTFTYSVAIRPGGRVLYLSPRGFLRMKVKEVR